MSAVEVVDLEIEDSPPCPANRRQRQVTQAQAPQAPPAPLAPARLPAEVPTAELRQAIREFLKGRDLAAISLKELRCAVEQQLGFTAGGLYTRREEVKVLAWERVQAASMATAAAATPAIPQAVALPSGFQDRPGSRKRKSSLPVESTATAMPTPGPAAVVSEVATVDVKRAKRDTLMNAARSALGDPGGVVSSTGVCGGVGGDRVVEVEADIDAAVSPKRKRPPSAYFIFCNENRTRISEKIAATSEGTKPIPSEVIKSIAEEWKGMPDAEKQPYEQRAAALKAEYDAEERANPSVKVPKNKKKKKEGKGGHKGNKAKALAASGDQVSGTVSLTRVEFLAARQILRCIVNPVPMNADGSSSSAGIAPDGVGEGQHLVMQPRTFKSGLVGWWGMQSMPLNVAGSDLQVKVQVNIMVNGSKHWEDGGELPSADADGAINATAEFGAAPAAAGAAMQMSSQTLMGAPVEMLAQATVETPTEVPQGVPAQEAAEVSAEALTVAPLASTPAPAEAPAGASMDTPAALSSVPVPAMANQGRTAGQLDEVELRAAILQFLRERNGAQVSIKEVRRDAEQRLGLVKGELDTRRDDVKRLAQAVGAEASASPAALAAPEPAAAERPTSAAPSVPELVAPQGATSAASATQGAATGESVTSAAPALPEAAAADLAISATPAAPQAAPADGATSAAAAAPEGVAAEASTLPTADPSPHPMDADGLLSVTFADAPQALVAGGTRSSGIEAAQVISPEAAVVADSVSPKSGADTQPALALVVTDKVVEGDMQVQTASDFGVSGGA